MAQDSSRTAPGVVAVQSGGLLRRGARAAGWQLRSLACLDLAPDHRASVLLAGSGRSGTTWLGEVIDRHHDHRVMFEPLKATAVPAVRHFANGQYLRPGDSDPRFVEPITRIVTGRLRNPWADHLNHVLIARKRLIKEIRANLLLGAIADRFDGMPIVLLVRHPMAVAASRRQLGWVDQLEVALRQPALVTDHLAPQRDFLAGLTDPFARTVAQWCIETVVPLRATSPEQVCLVSYEHLLTDPRVQAERVLRRVGQQPDEALEAALDKPSRLSRADSAVRTGADRTAAWRRHVSAPDLASAAEVLAEFGLDRIYRVDEAAPDLAALTALHRDRGPTQTG